mgnify:FL=1
MSRHSFTSLIASLCVITFQAASLTAQSITWWDKEFDAALTAAKDKPTEMVLLYCWEESDTCAAMFSGTMSDAKVAKALDDFICMGIKNDDAGKEVWARYKVGSVPLVLFVNPDGEVVDVLTGYVTIEQFVTDIERVKAGEQTIPSLRAKISTEPEDIQSAQVLVQKLRALQDISGSHDVIEAMIKVDPKGKSEAVAEGMLWKITDETFAEGIAPKDYDLAKLRVFLKSARHKRIKFLGHDQMATAHYQREDLKASAASAMKAWKNIPDDQVIDWGQRMCGIAYRRWKDLDKANKSILKNALKVSKKTLAAVEKLQKKQPDKTFLGNAMFLHAAILLVNKKRKDALKLMDDAIEIDPDNKNLKVWKDRWVSGAK